MLLNAKNGLRSNQSTAPKPVFLLFALNFAQKARRNLSCLGRQKRFLLWRSGWDSNPRTLADQTISSLVRTWYFRVCCGRWRQFWKRRKSLCCNGFRTHRPVLTSSISEKTRVQIEMRNAPKRSIFCTLARKYARRKPLSGMVLQTAPRIKCKKNRLKTDYTKRPFGPKHRKESSL